MPITNRWPTWSLIKLITTTTGGIITRSYINIIWVRVWGLLKLLSNLSSSTSSSNNTRPSRTGSTSSPSWTTTTSLTICHDWPWWLASPIPGWTPKSTLGSTSPTPWHQYQNQDQTQLVESPPILMLDQCCPTKWDLYRAFYSANGCFNPRLYCTKTRSFNHFCSERFLFFVWIHSKIDQLHSHPKALQVWVQTLTAQVTLTAHFCNWKHWLQNDSHQCAAKTKPTIRLKLVQQFRW